MRDLLKVRDSTRLVGVLAIVVSIAGGCSTVAGVGSDKTPQLSGLSVYVFPNPAYVGATVHATAAGFDQGGNPFPTGKIAWSTSSPGMAAVTLTAVDTLVEIKALAAGSVDIICTGGGITGRKTFRITPNPAKSVTLSPSTLTVKAGQNFGFTLTVLDAAGNSIDSGPPTWSTSDANIVTVQFAINAAGGAHAVAVGTATVTAFLPNYGLSASAVVTVIP